MAMKGGNMKNNFFEKNADNFYVLFRVVVGLLFILHGIMKWGVIASFSVTNLMFYAGIIEIVGGAFVLLGLFTRTAAVISALEMLYVFFIVHVFGKGFNLNPIGKTGNGGEAALFFLVAFLVIAAFGPRKCAIDKA